MVIIGIGFTALLAMIVPIGWLPTLLSGGGMHGDIFRNYSPVWYHLFHIVVAYAFLGAFVAFFFKKTSLASRLPDNPPGKGWQILGVVFIVIYMIPRLYASTIQGGGPSLVVELYAPYFLVPAKLLLIIGAVNILLAAAPDQGILQWRAAGSEYLQRVLTCKKSILGNMHLWLSMALSLPAAAGATIYIAYNSMSITARQKPVGVFESWQYYPIVIIVMSIAVFVFSLTVLITKSKSVSGDS